MQQTQSERQQLELQRQFAQHPHAAAATPHGIYTIAVLCYANVLNYADRYGVYAVLEYTRTYYAIGENALPLLATLFAFVYMLCAPVFGYLGDRRSRYALLLAAIALWWTAALLGSFCLGAYWPFCVCRLLVAVGQAGFSAVAPSVLADTVSGVRRTVALVCFYAGLPLGAGVGWAASVLLLQQRTGEWWWGMRVTAMAGALSVVAAIWLEVPARGWREAVALGAVKVSARVAMWDDFIFLLTNGTYVLTTLALTTVSYVAGVLLWWLPQYVYDGLRMMDAQRRQQQPAEYTQLDVSAHLALLLAASGVGGAAIGGVLSALLRPRYASVDALICCIGTLLAALLFAGMVLYSNENAGATYAFIFCCLLALNTNWTVAGDVLLYVALHTNRCMATALQMLVLHGLGGIVGPYVAAMTYENCRTDCGFAADTQDFHALRVALLTTFLAAVVGSAFYLVASYFVADERQLAVQLLLGNG